MLFIYLHPVIIIVLQSVLEECVISCFWPLVSLLCCICSFLLMVPVPWYIWLFFCSLLIILERYFGETMWYMGMRVPSSRDVLLFIGFVWLFAFAKNCTQGCRCGIALNTIHVIEGFLNQTVMKTLWNCFLAGLISVHLYCQSVIFGDPCLYSWPLNNMGFGAQSPQAVENPCITFDSPKT